MSGHHGAVFNNSCLKVPVNPADKLPYPVYDQKLINHLENQARKLSIDSDSPDCKEKDKDSLNAFIEFYDSIPEYDDVNHLSNRDFYKKLENLKEKQRSFYDYLRNEIKFETRRSGWIDGYKNLGCDKSPRKSSMKQREKNEDSESMVSDEKETGFKPPSRRSVRIESPPEKYSQENSPDLGYFRSKSRAEVSSAGSKRIKTTSPLNDSIFDDLSDLEADKDTMTIRSAPSSPRKVGIGWQDCGLTIRPFKMTVRDEEDRIVDEILIKKKALEDKGEMFRANPVPIESQIPLFDKIMFDQEMRRLAVKRRSKEVLRAQMRPFSFTKREEEFQDIARRLCKSTPCLLALHEEKPLKMKRFKAKPVPKNLFSNYAYRKMHEDEFYRALQRKIRSEEMLKAASLPPAMAKREKTKPKQHICPRTLREMGIPTEHDLARNKSNISRLERELAELELDYIMNSPSPKINVGKGKKKGKKGQRKFSAENKTNGRCLSALESVNRSNLASVLRIETARKRMEDEMTRRLEEARIKEEARWREKVLRKRPVWQTLAFSHEEDLAMRLQLRRDEERLRREEHKFRMQTMLGRVHMQPTLFERQSKARHARTREELIAKLYHNNRGRYSESSKLSSSDQSDRRSVVEMKDEAIQAQFDEIYQQEVEAALDGDGSNADVEDEEADDKI